MWKSSQYIRYISQLCVCCQSIFEFNRYSAVWYSCSLNNERRTSYALSLVAGHCQVNTTNVLKIVSTYATGSYRPETKHPSRRTVKTSTNDQLELELHPPRPEVNFTVCVLPFVYNYDNRRQLIEIIEINRMFGAERFVFYNYSTGSDVTGVLGSYADDDVYLISVVPWHVPVGVDVRPRDQNNLVEVHYFAQLSALKDCLYRNLFRSEFVVLTDLDELIVP